MLCGRDHDQRYAQIRYFSWALLLLCGYFISHGILFGFCLFRFFLLGLYVFNWLCILRFFWMLFLDLPTVIVLSTFGENFEGWRVELDDCIDSDIDVCRLFGLASGSDNELCDGISKRNETGSGGGGGGFLFLRRCLLS